MSVAINIDLDEVTAWLQVVQQMPEMTAHEMGIAMDKAVALIKRDVKARPPVNTGAMAAAWSSQVTRGRRVIKGEVVNPRVYAIVMEKGRRAGAKMPPVDNIQLWVTRKFGVSGREAEQLAFVIARSIGRKGIKGHHMLEKSFNASEPKIVRLFDDVPGTVFDRLK